MSKKITTGMRIEAKRLGLRPEDIMLNELREAKRIDRAITTAVRKERERCVGIATSVHGSNMHGGRGEGAWACEDIIKAIKGGVVINGKA